MGLRKRNTVLVHFRSGVVRYQCVLIMLDAELSRGKPKRSNKYWRYVSPQRTYFAWLPENLARTYCSNALDACGQIPYGEVGHLEPGVTEVYRSMFFKNIYHIGGYQECARARSLLAHAQRKIETRVWNPVHRRSPSVRPQATYQVAHCCITPAVWPWY